MALSIRWLAPAVAAFALVTVAGCGSESVEGSPTTTSGVAEPAFDPCTLPEDALRGVGVDPATAKPGIVGADRAGWNVCGWDASNFLLTLFQSNLSMEQVQKNPRNVDQVPVQVGSREAFTYHESGPTSDEYCDVAMGSSDGALLVRVEQRTSRPNPVADPCGRAVEIANVLDGRVPS
ncbi:DUF3558 domain-containing protein [Aldersonia sp. NBC_00410]|uniref:DUF3558 domain-containing protein n=1 Tax=Aldersonia sp. NBC_00410 TaxID=2975954 RepID=UPI002254111B|nr:DUF3558 domain-containing protein [Aldersonia sp. NBC_00410]MCX5043401.1 DUF3558 domain-containing protein [Aldersonia sp. NBC_00410]